MNAEEITFGINSLSSIVFGLGGGLLAWFKLKGKTELQQQSIDVLNEEVDKLHNRIDRLKEEVAKNREKSDNSVQEIKNSMNAMELRIIKAIHEIKKQ